MATKAFSSLDFQNVSIITGLPEPQQGSDAANKAYVDSAVAGGGVVYEAGEGLQKDGTTFSLHSTGKSATVGDGVLTQFDLEGIKSASVLQAFEKVTVDGLDEYREIFCDKKIMIDGLGAAKARFIFASAPASNSVVIRAAYIF